MTHLLRVKKLSPVLRSLRGSQFSTMQSLLESHPETEISYLENGIRVTSQEVQGETATVGVWLDTGSRYESEATNGVAHFLEHMFFKGTAKRTRPGLEVEIENMGAHLNAYTSREQTVFYAKVFKDDIPKAVEILADILQNSQYTEESITWEKDVILREMEEIEGQLEEVIFDRLHETAFRGSALSRNILGTVDNIKGMTRELIQEYISTHYVGSRMVIAGAGPIDHNELVQLSSDLFGDVPANGPTEPYMEPAKFTGSDIRVRFDDWPEAHIAYAFPTAGWLDSDNFALLVIQHMLGCWEHGNWTSHHPSPMVQEIAQRGLAKSVATFNTQYSDTGLFGVYAVAEDKGQSDLMWEICEAITGLTHKVDPDLMETAKTQLKMTMMTSLDGSTPVCEDIGRQVLTYGRHMHPLEVLARIDAVDVKAVKNCAKRYFYDQDFALAAIGPVWELPDYMWHRRRTYWCRY